MRDESSSDSRSPSSLRVLTRGATLAVAHFGINWLAHLLTPSSVTRNLLWPGPGVALAMLLRWGLGYWPAILIGSLAYSLWLGGSLPYSLVATGSLMAMVLPGVLWLRRRGVRAPLSGTRHVLDLLFVGAVLMPLIGSTIYLTGLRLAGQEVHRSPLVLEAVGWLTVAVGATFAAPVVLAWEAPRWKWSTVRLIEAVLLGGGALSVAFAIYGGMVSVPTGAGLGYMAFPFLMWAALRFGLTVTSTIASVTTLIALWGAAHGRGFLHHRDPVITILFADGFCVTLAATALLIASAIQEAQRSARALGKSEHAFRQLNEQASDAIFVSGLAGRLLEANARATQLLGYSRDEFRNLSVFDLIPPEDLEKHPPREVSEVGRVELFERRMRAKDGTIRTVEVSATRLDDLRVQAIVRDISDRKRTEGELREALSLLQATLDSTNDGILVVDTQGRIRSFNRKFVELWSIPEEIIASRDDHRALAFVLDQLKDPEAFLAQVQHLYQHPTETSFDVLEFKDGRVYERYSQAQTVSGVVQGRVWSFRDVTQRLGLEAQLRHAQKMEAVGELAGGVAHDFNNLLTAIMGHTSLLLARIGKKDPLREELGEIHRASERAALLTRQLLTFSRQQVLEPSVLDLNRVVRSMQQMLSRALGETIQIVLEPAGDALWIRVDAGQLEQVLLNLSFNARDAMPEGGVLRIETAAIRIEEDGKRPEMRAGDFVRLSFEDTGVGMDESTRLRAFDPFFTTKERGRGTGLGLSAVYGIVKHSGGAVVLESEPGRGTRFDLFFPRVSPESALRESAHPTTPAAGGRGPRDRRRLLLVEDEDVVRDLLREALAAAGFDVLTARHGQEALEQIDRDSPQFDLLVTDVVMPRMSGPELAERLLQRRPDLCVLFISGYTFDQLTSRVPLGSSVGFLQKPFSPAALIERISGLLEGRSER